MPFPLPAWKIPAGWDFHSAAAVGVTAGFAQGRVSEQAIVTRSIRRGRCADCFRMHHRRATCFLGYSERLVIL